MRFFPALVLIGFVLAGTTSAPAASNDLATCAKAAGDDAIAACGRLINSGARKGSELATVHVNRCLSRNAKKEYDRAVVDCSEAIRLDPKSSRAYGGRCWALNDKKDYDRAVLDCDEAIRLDPEYAAAYNNRCALWSARNDLDRALSDCGEALRLNPKSANTYSIRCDILRRKKEPDRAIADCDEAIKLSPKVAVYYLRRASAWRDKGDYDRSIADDSEAIRLEPKYVTAYNNRCVAWYFKKDHDRAVKDCSEAIRLDPKYHLAHYNRGNAWREKGAYDRAIEDYGETIRLDPKYVSAHSNRGLLYEKLAKYDLALADFRAAVAINPQSTISNDRVRRVERRLAPPSEPKPPVATSPAPAAKPPTVADQAPAPAAPTAKRPAPAPKAPVVASKPAEIRVALVIGNSTYSNVGSLPNAKNDAEKMAETFKRIGFTTVSLGLDLPREKIADALKAFAADADRAGWAVVYYAGHGIEFGGNNYLIPTDARLASDRDISFEAVALDQVLLAVEGAQKLRLVILDACRDNPFAKTMRRTTTTRSVGRGLARVDPEGATLVVYAARDGQVAQDGDGSNSPFATALSKYIETPGLEINFLSRKVRDDVFTATGRRQEPFVYGSLPAAEFYFHKQ